MTATIADIKARLAAIEKTITGVKRAYANGPASLPDTDFPVFVNFTGAASQTPYSGDGLVRRVREYLLRLYVAPAQTGLDGAIETKTAGLIEPVYAAFGAHPVLGHSAALPALAGVASARLTADSGPARLAYANTDYIGVEFRLSVTTFEAAEFAAGE